MVGATANGQVRLDQVVALCACGRESHAYNVKQQLLGAKFGPWSTGASAFMTHLAATRPAAPSGMLSDAEADAQIAALMAQAKVAEDARRHAIEAQRRESEVVQLLVGLGFAKGNAKSATVISMRALLSAHEDAVELSNAHGDEELFERLSNEEDATVLIEFIHEHLDIFTKKKKTKN